MTTVYIALEQSVLVQSKKVHIEDIATVFCTDADLSHKIKKSDVLTFTNTEQNQAVVTSMYLISIIHSLCKEAIVNCIGQSETIVYYKNLSDRSKRSGKIKAFFLMLIAFFGTAYSIMSYNEDVDAANLLSNLFTLFTNKSAEGNPTGLLFGTIAYSAGLCIGMIIFFNHGVNAKTTDDPTPLQVQMRLYEEDVNKTIIVDHTRNGSTIDIH